ncbi:MAG TPA: ergothioneine biosynthesis protein EgtB [Rhizomicrobium sp.]|jgi:ergothioneine biosynthesis protein EgtB
MPPSYSAVQTEDTTLARYRTVRSLSEALVRGLSAEDQCVQSMPDASPAKWHLAHTTWFFERMILAKRPGYKPFDPRFDRLFNSYYLGLGTPFSRPERGLLTRPGADEVMAYRHHVDAAMEAALADDPALVELGLNHEQQHQELLLTDIKHAFSRNPLLPAYCAAEPTVVAEAPKLRYVEHPGGVVEIGHGGAGFAFDNEKPRHQVLLRPFKLASRLVTNGEYQSFIDHGGYHKAEYWLSDGWAMLQREEMWMPHYWLEDGMHFTLQGVRPRDPAEPVTHVSFFEAAAYAAWARKRLPTEFEWEAVAQTVPFKGRFLDLHALHPRAADDAVPAQMFGDVWQWTRSSYDPYPGFKTFEGPASEYNGKFMVGQVVLRGGSCATPEGHTRVSYRNFFPPAARWQFSGIRLAEDL